MEIGLSITKIENFHDESNADRLTTDLDLLDKTRERAWICMATYKQKVARYYNAWVKLKFFIKKILFFVKLRSPSLWNK